MLWRKFFISIFDVFSLMLFFIFLLLSVGTMPALFCACRKTDFKIGNIVYIGVVQVICVKRLLDRVKNFFFFEMKLKCVVVTFKSDLGDWMESLCQVPSLDVKETVRFCV